MADRGPDYVVERRRLELQIAEHEDTIEKGRARLAEIERGKRLNLDRAEIANLALDDEARKVRENEESLTAKIEEINVNLKAMTKAADPPRE